MLNIFSNVSASLENCLFRSFANLFIGLLVFLLWSHVCCLYILEIKALSEISVANKCPIFSHALGSPFIWLTFSSATQQLFIWMNSHFLNLPLHPLRGDISVTKLLCGKSEIFLPIFSSRTFVVSQLLCKSFCHLEFIFVFGVRWWPSHMFCMSLYTSLNTICRLGYFHSILCLFSLCRILPDHRDMGLFLGSLFSSIDLCVCS